MKPSVTPREFNEIRISLEQAHKRDRFRGVVFTFWGLIAVKSLLAEWAIRKLALDISSFWVIGLSLLFSIFATVMYAQREMVNLRLTPMTSRLVAALWTGIIIVAVIISGVGVGSGFFDWTRVPGVLAVLFGLGYFVHGTIDPRIWYRVAAYGWWFSSIWLFTLPGFDVLAGLSLCLFLFQVIPGVLLAIQVRRPRSVPSKA